MLAGHAEQLRTHERRVVMSQRIRVGVVGARGRMGTATCEAVDLDPDTELVAEVDEGDSLNCSLSNAAKWLLISQTLL